VIRKTVWVYLHSNFRGWRRKTHVLCNGVRNGRSRSSKVIDLVPIKSAYATSCYSVTLVLFQTPRFRDIASFLLRTAPHPYSTQIMGCSPWTRLPMLGHRAVKTTTTIIIITFIN